MYQLDKINISGEKHKCRQEPEAIVPEEQEDTMFQPSITDSDMMVMRKKVRQIMALTGHQQILNPVTLRMEITASII